MNNVLLFFLMVAISPLSSVKEPAGHNPLVTNKQSSISMWAGLSVMNESAVVQGWFEDCFSKIVLLQMLTKAIGAVQLYLFVQYPRADTFMSTDYFIAEQFKTTEERKKLMEHRFAGYKALCTFGLGSLFWGSATGVLADWKEKAGWIEYIYLHSVVTFILLLNGLVASTFQSTAWFAPCVAGLGSWSALILFLGTAHLMSLKFHSYEIECLYSVVVSSVIVTCYWALSVQDPLPLYILVKTVLWILGFLLYVICCILYLLCRGFIWCIIRLVLLLWEFVWADENSIKNRLLGACSCTRDYVQLPGEQGSPPLV